MRLDRHTPRTPEVQQSQPTSLTNVASSVDRTRVPLIVSACLGIAGSLIGDLTRRLLARRDRRWYCRTTVTAFHHA